MPSYEQRQLESGLLAHNLCHSVLSAAKDLEQHMIVLNLIVLVLHQGKMRQQCQAYTN